MKSGEGQDMDIVAEWFSSERIPLPKIKHQTSLKFGPGCLLLQSNSARCLKLFEKSLCHYLSATDISRNPQLEKVRVEVYEVDRSLIPRGIRLPRSLRQKNVEIQKPKKIQGNRINTFYHLQLKDSEALWRPNDILASFSAKTGNPIKILISRASSKDEPFFPGRTAIPLRGIEDDVLLNLILVLTMRPFGLFCLHAASLSYRNQGLILTGPSGCGKTTTALVLLRKGFSLLSDELTLIPASANPDFSIQGVLFQPKLFSRKKIEISCLEESLSHTNRSTKKSLYLSKSAVLRSLYQKAAPRTIIFLDLKKNNAQEHRLTEIEEHAALAQLLDQIVDPTNATRHREIFLGLHSLITRCSLFRLVLGRDIQQLPFMIHQTLDRKKG